MSDHGQLLELLQNTRWRLSDDKLVIAHRDLGGDSLGGRARRVGAQASRCAPARSAGVALSQLGQ
eukprot:2428902-Pyramimonas_sp.AAC.1